ncbi:type II toxin-antitoxin system mRNA interferase toxin, RelE/StbE family [Sinorhizobium medicae]|uniref:type II toxin-antitoxin system RelE/ParE family toxin n=1 Tax=Sinorhizobium medicae TaxID=110321 RepID=UPI000FDA152B|nr:type II toxin-antitoxin system RelE/ParE family toxin [Sinorhizobium medicae]MDX0415069.1 type II toxin-antitoxin system mRNA interferase toxin, RelE/StbE family [Sinorhizobium medicae]MDX0469435.1 type II toxin-antitoxin system mRNA interferase toxin, RelE/StbE family [Sinorhizobium medicae]MDX0476179.1 type II toxin-antitoxin system mRNA interferase toxin, RelE/StbE family [Sinorhizobium medicae]MDX0500775.1 type II toxin-antitoxin system mRNA interferase toxin, RelE/StbE family [Sinorhizo
MIVEFSDEAESDLEQIADYIAKDNPRHALSFVQELRAKCERLGDTPKGFPLVPRYEQYGIRRRVHSSYLIFYRVEGEQIVIVHVLHGAMNYAAILFES